MDTRDTPIYCQSMSKSLTLSMRCRETTLDIQNLTRQASVVPEGYLQNKIYSLSAFTHRRHQWRVASIESNHFLFFFDLIRASLSSYPNPFQKPKNSKSVPKIHGKVGQYQADLTFLTRYQRQNSNYHILLVVINVNTKYVYVTH